MQKQPLATTTVYHEAAAIAAQLNAVQSIVVIQADNPDADSLASALALEHILGDMGKDVSLYCGVHIPDYLHFLAGWDRVSDELPVRFDASIIVDTSAESLLGILTASSGRALVASKPCIVIDHHAVEASIPFATIICNQTAVATGEVIYELAEQLDWQLSPESCEYIVSSIMSDSLGLTTEATSARSIHIIAELVSRGVSIALLEQRRRQLMHKPAELLPYKGQLLQRVALAADGRMAYITIPWDEIEKYSHAYNPSMLVMEDMRMVEGVAVVVAFKLYNDSKITAKIRCNYGYPIANALAEHFGGGGHSYASGFKITDGRSLEEIKSTCIATVARLLDELPAINSERI